MSKGKKAVIPELPEGYTTKHGVAWGSRVEGLLEIAYFNIKKKNASTTESQLQIGFLIEKAQKDENVKVILFHGGSFFSSGNDISRLASGGDLTEEEKILAMETGSRYGMVKLLSAMNRSVKPIVGLVRGKAIGIGFTMTSLFDFIYCTPEVTFSVPFMASAQSPEGGSTYTFVQQFGLRKANEILLMDRPITAQEAKDVGYINDILTDLSDSYWPELDKIPAVKSLLKTDYRTIVNCKEIMNTSKDMEKMEYVF